MEVSFRNMAKKQSTIQKRQNEEKMQQMVVAQHFAYSSAKRWVIALFFILVIFPVGINIALYFRLSDMIIGLLALCVIILLVLGEVVRGIIQKHKKAAAMIQQQFDLYVFDMKANYGLDENIISETIEKYIKKDWHRKKNWYQDYENMSNSKAVFYCQKENIDWTGNIAKRYKNFLLIIISLLLISFAINLIIQNQSVIKMLLIIIAAMPLISYGVSSYKKIMHDDYERKDMDKFARSINSNIDKLSEAELNEKTNILQTMIYKFRQTKYLIPDWFESIHYKRLQAIENRKTKARLDKENKKKAEK